MVIRAAQALAAAAASNCSSSRFQRFSFCLIRRSSFFSSSCSAKPFRFALTAPHTVAGLIVLGLELGDEAVKLILVLPQVTKGACGNALALPHHEVLLQQHVRATATGIVLELAVIHPVDALEGFGILAFARLVLAVELDLHVDTAQSGVGIEDNPNLLSIHSRPAAIDDLFEQG